MFSAQLTSVETLVCGLRGSGNLAAPGPWCLKRQVQTIGVRVLCGRLENAADGAKFLPPTCTQTKPLISPVVECTYLRANFCQKPLGRSFNLTTWEKKRKRWGIASGILQRKKGGGE